MTIHDEFLDIAQQVDDWFALIDLATGQLRDPVAGAVSLRNLSRQLEGWEGHIYENLSRNLDSFAEGLFSYQPVLASNRSSRRKRLRCRTRKSMAAAICGRWQLFASSAPTTATARVCTWDGMNEGDAQG